MTAPLRVAVDPRSPVPVFHQLREQITAMAVAGSLSPGTRLPSVRQLTADLGLAAGTVARAYRELEADGVVESRRRTATTVAAGRVTGDPVGSAVTALVSAARAAGLRNEDVIAAVREALSTSVPEPPRRTD